jgi:hypothetical protein
MTFLEQSHKQKQNYTFSSGSNQAKYIVLWIDFSKDYHRLLASYSNVLVGVILSFTIIYSVNKSVIIFSSCAAIQRLPWNWWHQWPSHGGAHCALINSKKNIFYFCFIIQYTKFKSSNFNRTIIDILNAWRAGRGLLKKESIFYHIVH